MSWFNLAGSAVSAIGGLLGGSSANKSNLQAVQETNAANKSIAQMNNAYNERMMKKQMDYNTMMWEKENEYNTAANQAARLRAAGLNPAMVMSGANAGTAGSAGGVTPPTATPVQMQPGLIDNSYIGNSLDKLSQGFIAHQQLQNDKARVSVEQQKAITQLVDTLSNVESRKVLTQGQKILNSYLDTQKNLELQGIDLDNQFKKAQHSLAVKQGSLVDVQTLIANKQLGQMDELHQKQLADITSRISLNYAQKKNVDEATKQTKENIKLVAEQIKSEAARYSGLKLSNQQAHDLAPYVLRRAQLDAVPSARQNFFLRANGNRMQTFFDGIETVLQPYIPFAK